uniref:Uncharacterized protein n=1 Tax=Cacopsylla melanoneura TaxID=428564 RepID=A0A8D8WAS0_9HEMI
MFIPNVLFVFLFIHFLNLFCHVCFIYEFHFTCVRHPLIAFDVYENPLRRKSIIFLPSIKNILSKLNFVSWGLFLKSPPLYFILCNSRLQCCRLNHFIYSLSCKIYLYGVTLAIVTHLMG